MPPDPFVLQPRPDPRLDAPGPDRRRCAPRECFRMIADIVETGIASWWAPPLAFAAGLDLGGEPVRLAAACPATCRSSPARACSRPKVNRVARSCRSCCSSPGSRSCSCCSGAFASTFVEVFRGDVGQRIGGALVIAFGVLMLGYAFGRGSVAAVRGAAAVPAEGPAGHGGGPAARDGVRRRLDALHRAGARVDPGDRGLGQHRPGVVLLTAYSPASACRSCWWAWGSLGSWEPSGG